MIMYRSYVTFPRKSLLIVIDDTNQTVVLTLGSFVDSTDWASVIIIVKRSKMRSTTYLSRYFEVL